MILTSVAIRRPLFMLMVILSLVVFGLVSFSRLGVDLNPNVNFPVVSVVTPYPGAGSGAVDRLVTKPIEDAVAGINGIDYIQSSSSRGVSNVTIVFKDGVNADTASIEVERKVNASLGGLPNEAERPTIVKADLQAEPVISLALSGERPLDQLQRVADDQVKDRLAALGGVSQVNVYGGQQREVHVLVDQERLQARGLSLQQVTQALGSDNLDTPSGKLTEGGRDFNVRVDVRYANPEDLANVIVADLPTGPVFLRDVATVQDGFKDQTVVQRVNGKDSVGITVIKAASGNTVQVVDEVKKELKDIQATLPPGVTIDVVLDTSEFINASLGELERNLVEAVLLTGLVLLFFLHTLRSTFIVLLAIPTSIVSTFLVMYLLGFTLNQMSMLALALCVGILVDDSIVVLENIFRHLKLGETPWTAALKGRSEIGLAAIAITLVDVVVFTPVAFMSGIVGQFFRQFGLVVAAATLFSLFVSFTLTPLLASRWLAMSKPKQGRNLFDVIFGGIDKLIDGLERLYRLVLRGALRFRWVVVFLSMCSFGAGIAILALGLVGTEFFPAGDQGEFTLQAEMPPGSSLETTSEAVRQVESQLQTWPEVERLFTTVGVDNFGGGGQARFATITAKMVDKQRRTRSSDEVSNAARQLTAGIPGIKLRASQPGFGGGTQPIQVQVLGPDRAQLEALSQQVEQIVRAVPGTTDVTNSGVAGQPEVVVNIDRVRASDLGLNSSQVAAALRTSVEGTVATKYRPASGDDVDVRVRLDQGYLASVDEISKIVVLGSGGQEVRLGQIADIREQLGPPQLDRRDRLPVVTVGAATFGRPVGDVSADLQERMKVVTTPNGYQIKLGGDTEAQTESFAQIVQALGLSMLLMYMLMVALFESLLLPLVVMLALPLAVIGAIGALAVTGNTINIISMIGMIMLTGLVGKNAILLVDYTNTLRARGLERNAALLEAGPTRLRPILMTTIAMVLAMSPLAFGLGQGSEWRAPMAITVIGGLITSTLLTLVLIPAVYTIFDDLRSTSGRLIRFIFRRKKTPSGPPTAPDETPRARGDGRRPTLEKVPASVAGGSE